MSLKTAKVSLAVFLCVKHIYLTNTLIYGMIFVATFNVNVGGMYYEEMEIFVSAMWIRD
jgi:hypothetical protein